MKGLFKLMGDCGSLTLYEVEFKDFQIGLHLYAICKTCIWKSEIQVIWRVTISNFLLITNVKKKETIHHILEVYQLVQL